MQNFVLILQQGLDKRSALQSGPTSTRSRWLSREERRNWLVFKLSSPTEASSLPPSIISFSLHFPFRLLALKQAHQHDHLALPSSIALIFFKETSCRALSTSKGELSFVPLLLSSLLLPIFLSPTHPLHLLQRSLRTPMMEKSCNPSSKQPSCSFLSKPTGSRPQPPLLLQLFSLAEKGRWWNGVVVKRASGLVWREVIQSWGGGEESKARLRGSTNDVLWCEEREGREGEEGGKVEWSERKGGRDGRVS